MDVIGPTSKYPEGKLHASDRGELRLAVGTLRDEVVIEFGADVNWLALPAENAVELAEMIAAKAQIILQRKDRRS